MYLQPTITVTQSINIIKDKIKSNEPFALSRYGDGEINILNRSTPPKYQKRGCNIWGYKYPSEVNYFFNDASTVILNAIRHSDGIGLMDRNNQIAKNITYKEHIWSIKTEFLESAGIDTNNLIIFDHQLPRMKEFGKPENFKEILQGKSLNIISPNTEILKKKNLGKLFDTDVTFTHHPHNINFRNRNEFIEGFKDIKSDVVLVGCGIQKDYVSYLRYNHNKVAIDVGALLDAWSGIISRPWFNEGSIQNYLVL